MAISAPDSSEQTERFILELLRKKTPVERMRIASDLTQSVRQMVRDAVRRDYPNASEEEVLKRFAARWLGRDLAIKAYGWDPDQHGW